MDGRRALEVENWMDVPLSKYTGFMEAELAELTGAEAGADNWGYSGHYYSAKSRVYLNKFY